MKDDLIGLAAFDQFQHERIPPMPFDPKVKLCQELLTAKRYPCVVDGVWGRETMRQLGAALFEHGARSNEDPLPAGVTDEALETLRKSPGWVRGIDVARYQGRVDFEAVKKSGVSFVIIKAGGADSGMYNDSRVAENLKAAKAAGLLFGLYYFHSFEQPATRQAEHFFDLIGTADPGEILPCLDVEDRKTPMKPAAALAHIKATLARMEELFKVVPLLYTSASLLVARGINTKDNGLEKYPLWVPRYGAGLNRISAVEKSIPACYPSKKSWKIWQVGFDNDLAGIEPDVDRNFFQGSLEEFKAALCVK